MRLDIKEREAIKNAILEFDPNARIYLFGSRTEPQKFGGDIDILVLSQSLKSSDKNSILVRIFEQIEEQKIDLIIAKDISDPFVRMAFKTGTEL